MKSLLRINRIKRTDIREENNLKLNTELDNYGIKLIKVIGVFGLIAGIVILLALFIWAITELFKL
jgi:hypothetical protein